MLWQLCCHGRCKIMYGYDSQEQNYSKSKFLSNSNSNPKFFNKMGNCFKEMQISVHTISTLDVLKIPAAWPCITVVIWCCHKTFSQWQCSFHWKLHCHWLKGLWQRQITVIIQDPELKKKKIRTFTWLFFFNHESHCMTFNDQHQWNMCYFLKPK